MDNSKKSQHGNLLINSLPPYYGTSRIMQSLQESQGYELDDLDYSLDEVLNQLFINTSTWGLATWEHELGIPSDSSKPIDQRRSVVMSKIRGVGTVTVSLVKNVAEAYDGGKVDVTQYPEKHSVTIKFVDTLGIPPNLDDLKQAIYELMPAHLAVNYEFSYSTWLDVKRAQWNLLSEFTWGEVNTRRWN